MTITDQIKAWPPFCVETNLGEECFHGSLRRKCATCDAQAEADAYRARLRTTAEALRNRIASCYCAGEGYVMLHGVRRICGTCTDSRAVLGALEKEELA